MANNSTTTVKVTPNTPNAHFQEDLTNPPITPLARDEEMLIHKPLTLFTMFVTSAQKARNEPLLRRFKKTLLVVFKPFRLFDVVILIKLSS